MVFYNIRYILRKILYIIKWSIPALLTILLIVFCFFIMTSRSSAYVDTTTSDVLNFYIDDSFYNFIKNSEYYSDDYNFFAWCFTYNNVNQWNVIIVNSNDYDYVVSYDTSTKLISYNPLIDDFYQSSLNAQNDIPNFHEIVHREYILYQNAWYDQTGSVRNPTIGNVLNVPCVYFYGSPNSVILNGNSSNKINFPTISSSIATPTPTPTPTSSNNSQIAGDVSSIDNTIGGISGFLQDSNINENLIEDGFPSINIAPVQAETLLDSIFGSLRDIFTGEVECDDVVFQFPFSNNTVTFRADYMETHLPVPIITIIRALYWYVICRFIIIDILRYIDRIRQGDYFMSSDSNIKTEVL